MDIFFYYLIAGTNSCRVTHRFETVFIVDICAYFRILFLFHLFISDDTNVSSLYLCNSLSIAIAIISGADVLLGDCYISIRNDLNGTARSKHVIITYNKQFPGAFNYRGRRKSISY